MKKINKIVNVVLIFMIIEMFLWSGLSYSKSTSLRAPIISNDPKLKDRSEKALNLLIGRENTENENTEADITRRIESTIRKDLLKIIKGNSKMNNLGIREVEETILRRRMVMSGEIKFDEYVEKLRFFVNFYHNIPFTGNYFDNIKAEVSDILAFDIKILQDYTFAKERGYAGAALGYIRSLLGALEDNLIVKTKKEKIKLSSISRYYRHIHSLDIKIYTEKVKKVVALVQNHGQITEEFLQSISVKGEEQIAIVEIKGIKGDKELYILQGNHRLAVLVTLYNLGFIGDIEIEAFYGKGDKDDMKIISEVDEIFSIIGRSNENIDFNRLRITALQIITETGSNIELEVGVSHKLINTSI